jgi:uncharacterized lipoprotein YmbA
MIHKFRITSAVAICLPAVLLVSACAITSRPVDFYTLSPASASGGAQTSPALTCRDVVIGIGPVVWPRYLDRPQIVTRRNPYRISFDEFHRWGGPLEEDFERVLAEDLSKLLQTDYVIKYPGKFPYQPRYRVQLRIDQFDGLPGDAVTLKAAWSVADQNSDKAAALHESTLRVPTSGEGYEPMVVAASATVAELSRQVATEISSRCALMQEK